MENNTTRVWRLDYSASDIHIHINDDIGHCSDYNHELQAIYSANENDTVYVHLCTGGGSLWTMCQFRSALASCRAHTVAVIEGPCHSAGSMLALCCKELVVHDTAYMLIHNYSGGDFGKGKELVESVLQGDAWLENLFHSVYKDFLTKEEVIRVRNDHDIHLFADEIVSRWGKVVAAKQEEAERQHKEVLENVIEQAKNL